MVPENIIRLSKSSISESEISSVVDVLKKGYLGMGQKVQEFESLLSEYFGRPTVCVNTGTAALQLACQALEIEPGDEILVQSLTYVASFQAIHASGATPISCEVNPKTGCIDINDAEKRITKKTRAIMPVHYAGNADNLLETLAFAKKHNLRVIEDAAHAFGTKVGQKLVGSFGDIVCFSFDGIKNITSGEGGCVVSDDPKIISLIKDARLLGVIGDSDNRYKRQRTWEFDVQHPGWRYHMSEVMAAIGVEQFKRKDTFREKRQQLVKKYRELLKDIKNVLPFEASVNCDVNPHIFPVRILQPWTREKIKSYLEAKGIQTGIHYFPNHLLTLFKSSYSLPITENIYKELLTLPLHYDLTDSDIEKVVSALKDFKNE